MTVRARVCFFCTWDSQSHSRQVAPPLKASSCEGEAILGRVEVSQVFDSQCGESSLWFHHVNATSILRVLARVPGCKRAGPLDGTPFAGPCLTFKVILWTAIVDWDVDWGACEGTDGSGGIRDSVAGFIDDAWKKIAHTVWWVGLMQVCSPLFFSKTTTVKTEMISRIFCTLKSRINSHTVGAGKSSNALKAQETLSAWSKKSG